jgi:hypothetical protein
VEEVFVSPFIMGPFGLICKIISNVPMSHHILSVECRSGSSSLSKWSRSSGEIWTQLSFCSTDSSFGTQHVLKFNSSWIVALTLPVLILAISAN